MAKVKCYSVRLESIDLITPKCYKAKAFDGSVALIPASCFYGQDLEVSKSEAYWIAAFILEKDDCKIQFSTKKVKWFNN